MDLSGLLLQGKRRSIFGPICPGTEGQENAISGARIGRQSETARFGVEDGSDGVGKQAAARNYYGLTKPAPNEGRNETRGPTWETEAFVGRAEAVKA